MSDPDWDMALDFEIGKTRYDKVVERLAIKGSVYRAYGRQMIWKKVCDGKALINESKIGIASDITMDATSLSVYESSYFATLCSADLSLKDFCYREANAIQVEDSAINRAAFHTNDLGQIFMNRLSSTNPSISMQLGVNMIVVTKDNILRIAFQGRGTMFGQGKRVPFASGSMDWEDIDESATVKSIIKTSAVRELQEEWGGPTDRAKDLQLDAYLPVGFFRVPDRGGKLEAAVLAKLNWNFDELIADRTEVLDALQTTNKVHGIAAMHYEVSTFDSFKSAIKSLIEEHGEDGDATPLYGVLMCIQDLIDRRPDRLITALGYD